MTIELRVPAQLRFRELAVQAVAAACRLVGDPIPAKKPEPGVLEVRTEFAIRAVSSFSEVFNNIVEHAYAGGDDALIDIRIETSASGLRLVLEDHGRPFDLDARMPTHLDPTSASESGRGLFIIRAFVDNMSYTPGPPNRWTLEINEQSASRPHDVYSDI